MYSADEDSGREAGLTMPTLLARLFLFPLFHTPNPNPQVDPPPGQPGRPPRPDPVPPEPSPAPTPPDPTPGPDLPPDSPPPVWGRH